eukprot:5438436-Pyramimonas_sp.AAC.1
MRLSPLRRVHSLQTFTSVSHIESGWFSTRAMICGPLSRTPPHFGRPGTLASDGHGWVRGSI